MEGPKGKYAFGAVKVGQKGQIVIPKDARDIFGIKTGDTLVLLGDIEQGLAIVKAETLSEVARNIFKETKGEKQ